MYKPTCSCCSLPLGYASAALIALITLGVWISTGAHTGWTQTKIPTEHVDEFTGLTYTEYQEGFIAGVEVLGGGLILAALVFAVTFFIRKRKPKTTQPAP